MLPGGGYSTPGYGNLSFRDDVRGYRKKGQLSKQLRKAAPLGAGFLALCLVLTIIVMGSQVSRLRGELQKADAINGHQKDDNVRLQRLYQNEHNEAQRSARELTRVQAQVSGLEASLRQVQDTHSATKSAADTHNLRADELQANLVSQTRMTQLANADRDNALVKVSNLEAKLLESSREHEAKDHRLADLETRLLGAIQSDHLKTANWDRLRKDLEAELAGAGGASGSLPGGLSGTAGDSSPSPQASPPPDSVQAQGVQGAAGGLPGGTGGTLGGSGATPGPARNSQQVQKAMQAAGLPADGALVGLVMDYLRGQQDVGAQQTTAKAIADRGVDSQHLQSLMTQFGGGSFVGRASLDSPLPGGAGEAGQQAAGSQQAAPVSPSLSDTQASPGAGQSPQSPQMDGMAPPEKRRGWPHLQRMRERMEANKQNKAHEAAPGHVKVDTAGFVL